MKGSSSGFLFQTMVMGLMVVGQTSVSFADGVRTRHRVEVGSGIETVLNGEGVNLLLRFGYGISQTPGDLNGDLYEGEQLVWAHVTGDFGVNTAETGWDALPYMNITVTPVHNSLAVNLENGKMWGDLAALPVQIKRDIPLNQEAYFKVAVAGIKLGKSWEIKNSERFLVFVQAVADVLGYKYVDYLNKEHFHGGRILGFGAEGGLAIVPSTGFRLQWVIGGNFDVNTGSDGSTAVFQSDMEAYTALRLDLTRFIDIYVKLSQFASCIGNANCDFTPRLMAGASIQF